MSKKNGTVILKDDLMKAYENLSQMDDTKKSEQIKKEEEELKKIVDQISTIDDRIFEREIKKKNLDIIIRRYSKTKYDIKKMQPTKKELNRTLKEKFNVLFPLITFLFVVIIILLMAVSGNLN